MKERWYLYDTHYNLHMLIIFFMRSSPLVHIIKWWLSVKDKKASCFKSLVYIAKPWDLCKARLMIWSFYNPSSIDIWTFWLSLPSAIRQETRNIAGWIINWAMWRHITQGFLLVSVLWYQKDLTDLSPMLS